MSWREDVMEIDVCPEAMEWIVSRSACAAWFECPRGDWLMTWLRNTGRTEGLEIVEKRWAEELEPYHSDPLGSAAVILRDHISIQQALGWNSGWRARVMAMRPWHEPIDWIAELSADTTAEHVWATCPRGDWMLWIAREVDRPVLCGVLVEIVGPVLERANLDDPRPSNAFALVDAVSRGETVSSKDLGTAAAYAADAVSEVGIAADLAACAAACAAAYAIDAAAGEDADAACGAGSKAVAYAAKAAARCAETKTDRLSELAGYSRIVRKHITVDMALGIDA